jgi:hypothetical protein
MVAIVTMTTRGHGFNILSALSGFLVSFACYTFVDGTYVIHSVTTMDTTGKEVIKDMQIVLDWWGGVI